MCSLLEAAAVGVHLGDVDAVGETVLGAHG